MDASKITSLRAKYAEILAENDWEIFDRTPTVYASLTGDAELWRSLPELSPDFIAEFTDLLNVITDIKNTVARAYVDDPMAGGEVFPGRWRKAFIRRIAQGDVTKLVQVLRKGYATAIDWTEARLVEGILQQPLGAATYKTQFVRWVNCSREAVEAMAASINDASFTDPVINGETLSGAWYNSGVKPSIADDGSGVVTLELSQKYRDIPFQTSAISGRATIQTRQQLGVTTETPESLAATAGQIKTQGISVQGDSSKNIQTQRDIGTAQTTKITSVSADESVVREEKTVQIAQLAEAVATDGKIKQVTNKNSDYSQRFDTAEEERTGIAQTVINTFRSPSETVVTTDKTVQAAEVAVPALEAGVLKRIRNVWSRFYNRWDTTEEVNTGIPQTVINTIKSPSETVFVHEKTVQNSEEAVPALEGGVLRRIRNIWSKYHNRWDTIQEVELGIAQTAIATGLTGTEKIETTEKTVQQVQLTIGSFVQGIIRRIVNGLSKYPERYTTTEEVRTAIPASVSEYIAHLEEHETIYVSEEKHAEEIPVIALGATDTSITLSHDLDDFLTHNLVKTRVVRTPPLADGETLTWDEYGDIETIAEYRMSSFLSPNRLYIEYLYIYQKIYNFTLRYFKTEALARAWLAVAPATSAIPQTGNWNWGDATKYEDNSRNSVIKTGPSEYRTIRVTTTNDLRLTSRFSEPDE